MYIIYIFQYLLCHKMIWFKRVLHTKYYLPIQNPNVPWSQKSRVSIWVRYFRACFTHGPIDYKIAMFNGKSWTPEVRCLDGFFWGSKIPPINPKVFGSLGKGRTWGTGTPVDLRLMALQKAFRPSAVTAWNVIADGSWGASVPGCFGTGAGTAREEGVSLSPKGHAVLMSLEDRGEAA